MKFTKMHGCGNDYVYINCFTENIIDKTETAKIVSDRHFGIGGDGAIFIKPSNVADFEMEMFNADGSGAEMCGNGIRCVAKYVYDKGLTDKTSLSIISAGNIKYLELYLKDNKVDMVKVNMGAPEIIASKIPVQSDKETVINEPITIEGYTYHMTCVSMGNPHAVIFLENVDNLPIDNIGHRFETHPIFPNRTNTEFAHIIDRNTLQMRVWERGAGETLACGTGACATAVAAILNGLTENKVTVKLLGGQLDIEWDREANLVYMTGPATTVFEGETDLV